MEPTTLHDTLIFERTVAAPPDKVFSAYADISMRTEWGAPSANSVLIYDQSDFREGGSDRFRCGPKSNPNIHGVTTYLEITENRRIVSTETIMVDGKHLCASLSTLELMPDGEATSLKITTQLVSFVGEVMVGGHQSGMNSSLNNLVGYFATRKGSNA